MYEILDKDTIKFKKQGILRLKAFPFNWERVPNKVKKALYGMFFSGKKQVTGIEKTWANSKLERLISAKYRWYVQKWTKKETRKAQMWLDECEKL